MRPLRFFRPHLVGLDIGSDAVKAVVLRPVRGAWSLVAAVEVPVSGTGTSDPEALHEALNEVFTTLKVRRANIASALSGQAVIVKRLSLPAMTDDELAESIPWEAEQYIPFDLSDVHLDYQVLVRDASRSSIEVLLVAAKKERIDERTSLILRAGRRPVLLDVEAFALANAYHANYPDHSDALTLLLHIGRAGTIVCLLDRGQLAFTRDIALGGQSYTEALMRDLDVEPATAERIKHSGRLQGDGVDPAQASAILRDVTAQLVAEVSKSVEFYRATAPIEAIGRIVLSGGGCHAEGLTELLSAEFDAPAEFMNPFLRVARGAKHAWTEGVEPTYAVAVGLAMRQDGAA